MTTWGGNKVFPCVLFGSPAPLFVLSKVKAFAEALPRRTGVFPLGIREGPGTQYI
jgi:hypothetical protein